jgi:inositol oxygenase
MNRHLLGSVVKRIDARTAAESEDDYDWTLARRTRVVGCAAPARVHFGEFRHLNKDERDDRYSSLQGMYELHCGLNQVLLAWTGPEYMYQMLRHNGIMIPEEGFAMLRFFALGDWHAHNEYECLTDDIDILMQPFVSDFDHLRRSARRSCCKDMSDKECEELWGGYYEYIVEKYAGDGLLKW